MTAVPLASETFYFVHQYRSPGQRVVHAHSGIEVHFLEEGDGYYSVGVHRKDMIPGRLTLLFGPRLHRVISNPRKTYCRTVLHVPEHVIARTRSFLGLNGSWLLPDQRAPVLQLSLSMHTHVDLRRVFHHIQREVRRQGGGSDLPLTPRVTIYLAELLHIVTTQGTHVGCDRRGDAASPYDQYLVDRACEIITDYGPDLSVNAVADELGVSSGHLWRVFVAVLGMNPREYLLEHRMNTAKSLLLRGESVSAVAEKCGYSDLSSFSRAFKGHVGLPPRSYVRMYG